MIRAHVSMIHGLLSAAGLTVYGAGVGTDGDDGTVPDRPVYPYALLAFPGPISGSESMGDLRERQEFDFTVTAVGDSPASVWAVADLVNGALDGAEPVLAGRLCRITNAFSDDATRDDDVSDRVVWFARLGFTLVSYAA